MASYKEMQSIGQNPARVRDLARRLLATDEDWTDWELDFLEAMADHFAPEALTTRQREKLIELRDDAELIDTTREGFSVRLLLDHCWELSLDLDDEDDVAFIEKRKGSRAIKRRDVGRLLRCAHVLGVIDED